MGALNYSKVANREPLRPIAVTSAARAASTDPRRLERRRVYLGEGLTLRLHHASSRPLSGEIIDLTPEGIGIAVPSSESVLREGAQVTIEHTGRGTAGISQRGIVMNVTTGIFGGRTMQRIGVAFVVERTVESHARGLPARLSRRTRTSR